MLHRPRVLVAAPMICSLLAAQAPMVVDRDLTLDPAKQYGALVVTKSSVTIDGRGAMLVGARDGDAKTFQGVGILVDGQSSVTIKNVRVRGFETGLVLRNGSGHVVEGCDFSDNFHDPAFGWGENGRRGGIVLDDVTKCSLRGNHAHRVWDACVLLDANDNVLVGNDFSNTSNTCLKLWHACRNEVRDNVLAYGIRKNPGEVHARDSTSVLIESGSDDNRLVGNDCRHGGDGIFVRVLNGWCSVGNHFEGNDCSHANNNAIECWAPRNTWVRNKANHSSYGFWMGGSDQSRLIENEASFNGLPDGPHNSPHLPDGGHAGIVFLFGPSSHTVVRGNRCEGNHGAGIVFVGDLDSKGQKWRAWHWVLEDNVLSKNRWGLYGKHADWIVARGNRFEGNVARDVWLDGDVQRFVEDATPRDRSVQPPSAKLAGPSAVRVAQPARWRAGSSSDPAGRTLQYSWEVDGAPVAATSDLVHTFERVGFHRIGLNVDNGMWTEVAWANVYVTAPVDEFGTEAAAAQWGIEDFHERERSHEQVSRASFTDTADALVGKQALGVVIAPYAGFRAALTFPQTRAARMRTAGKSTLCFWLKAINEDVTGWQGGPFIVLHGADGSRCHIEPQEGLDLMREVEHNEAREGWRRFVVPLRGDARWRVSGTVPEVVAAVSLCFDSWGAPTLRLSLDGLAWQ